MDVIAVGAALASATGFAASTSLQHEAAGGAAEQTEGLADFVRHLLGRPTWLLGQALALASFVLHAVALHFGPLALVQPIVVSGVVIAVPARAALSRRLPSGRELLAVSVATAGLAVFLVASDPSAGSTGRPGWTPFLMTVAAVAVAAAAVRVSVRSTDRRRAAGWLGVSAGVLFGVVAGLVKLTVDVAVTDGVLGALGTWPPYLLLLCGAGGIVSNQRAYTLGSLASSLPVLNIVNVVVSLVFGLVVFDEVPAHGPLALLLEVVAVATAGLGLREIARVEEEPAPTHPDAPGEPAARHPERPAG